MKVWRPVSLGCAVALATSLLLARTHPFGDANLHNEANAQPSKMKDTSLPPAVGTLLMTKCADCHSMQTHALVYGRFAPISWLMERDIVEGRKAFNFAQWDAYTADQQQTIAAKIVQETKSHRMPLVQYRIIHWDSNLSNANIQTLVQWSHGMQANASEGPGPAPTGSGDAVRGKEVFERRCNGCHTLTQDREGPRLQGVYGRTSGTVAGFTYSPALKKAGIVWNEATLDKWLSDPDSVAPGNEMDFRVPKPDERRDLIKYLQQSAGQ
ncbi:heme-binding domain-containing protein [Tunturiibacter lichenicola]|uniref:heme-binding domain-containing protein n=1 Tax=Tunturiibacter lichenicola TaxID=2051959 RepID=UPI0021B3FE8C|nr:heme-binding domain-containing protein [Edaphobacter lichenicola]